ncbi:hypothetical protein AAFF_G00192080 [Aldrovandia affinis]|uniref:Uncharacterized protein n=1 Tax=Aldrovandia affinis TaxID=143900 RepID=A0AAD7RJB6_9TELE|nr:hypothetical protein AAFF_G00192080 [Aldrovandia affinis]
MRGRCATGPEEKGLCFRNGDRHAAYAAFDATGAESPPGPLFGLNEWGCQPSRVPLGINRERHRTQAVGDPERTVDHAGLAVIHSLGSPAWLHLLG